MRDGPMSPPPGLPAIPYVEAPAPLALVEALPEQVQAIVDAGLRHYGPAALAMGDRLSLRWLRRSASPYRDEVLAVARRLGQPGGLLLNLSYEWACTAAVGADPAGAGNRMLRTLDWPLAGLGRTVVVARHDSPAGAYLNVTWPGFVGVLTAMAPGRFAAAINQPPLRRYTAFRACDWLISRAQIWRRTSPPPSHLLRRVFETARSYAEARAMLSETPLCLPAFFTLSGAAADEGCVIERLEERAVVHEGPVSIANHFLGIDLPARERGRTDSQGRRRTMQRLAPAAGDDFDWVQPPIRNTKTRLAVAANAGRGTLAVQGWEADGPATAVFRLPAPSPAGTPGTRAGRPAAAPA